MAQISPLFATESPSSLQELLKNHTELRVSWQPLAKTDTQFFPQNCIITFPPRTRDNSGINTVIFAFTKEYAEENPEFTLEMIEALKELILPYTLELVFTSNDHDIAGLPKKKAGLTGTEVFADSCEHTENLCAVVFLENKKEGAIVAGSPSDTSPSYLVKTLANVRSREGKTYSLPHSYGFMFQNGGFPSDKRIEAFLSRDIAASGIVLDHSMENISTIKSIATRLSETRTTRWDRQYSYIPIGTDGIWLNEIFYILLFASVSASILFGMCLTPLFVKTRHEATRRDFFRSWYFLPAQIAVLFISLSFSDLIFKGLGSAPIVFFAFKSFFTMLITFSLLWFQAYKGIKVSFPALGYQMRLVAGINLLIASWIDLTLLTPFFFEYMIIWFMRRAKSKGALIAELVLLFLPFLTPWTDMILHSQDLQLLHLMGYSFGSNFLIAIFFVPIATLWQRMAILSISNRTVKSEKKLSKTILHLCLDVLIPVVLIVSSYLAFSLLHRKNFPKEEQPLTVKVIEAEGDEKSVHISHTKSEFMGLSSHTVQLEGKKKILRYEVSISEENGIPFYESNYGFVAAGETSYFEIPDFPQGPVNIIFSTDKDADSTLTVNSWFLSDDGEFYHEEQEMKLRSKE